MMDDKLIDLQDTIAQMLTQLVENQGFEFPITVVLVTRHGQIMGGTYKLIGPGEVDCDITVDNMKEADDAMMPPISILFVDGKTGTTWLAGIGEQGKPVLMT